MACRALLRRKRFLFDYLNSPSRSIQGLSSFGHGRSTQCLDSWVSSRVSYNPCADFNHRKEENVGWVGKYELFSFSEARFIKCNSFGISILGCQNGRPEFMSPLAIRWMSQSILNASTATARQPELSCRDEEIAKQIKEASPEECDQVVEGLSSAKAKAKAKQLQEPQKSEKSMLQRVWTMILGIGPALRVVASMSREDWAKKLCHWKDDFKATMQHYWLGTKLLWADVRISSRLLLKLSGGKNLSRREKQQLTRTTADIFRLVPFAVFVIVPFMEFLLPVFLKLFPNMLPSTFQDKMKEQEALKRRLIVRIQYAKFLQDTVKEMAKEVQNSRSGEIKKTAEDLDEFLNKVRTGGRVSNEEILGFAKLFNDELTLDNVSRSRLVNMCKYMGINPYGTDAYLRYMLRKRLRWIKNDDRMIRAEGIESLSEAELRQACRDRGLLGMLSTEEMHQQLHDWLDLSLNHSVPSSLLILSRAFTVAGKIRPEEAVQATLSSLPDEVVDTVGVTALPSEDSVSERRRKLEFLEMQEELIKEEEVKEEQEQARMKESALSHEDVALKEMTLSTAREAQQQAIAQTLEKQEQLCELSRALAVLASVSSVSREREEFLSLVNKEIELYNSMVEKEGTDGEEEAKRAYRAAREESDHAAERALGDKVSSALIERPCSWISG
ncbi:PREDICTED: LETM1 and EF-hand domain-containing protein 1, mitochondrial-like isoform X2 [Nelumbo nucifera]|uniref:LETM1 and EF-hand domain-containing protein 1, mitochondrial-like isoform X2 n=1 Tax=Nelumbo nucifera TaxID=4432 RepID=A0A1U7YQV1_NELNU|nr:PREDICTED: LETM1 and EF-hand domain-containing protein 1, mitochondrial-like isoform X2 [Nelumbo nucifera]